MDQDHLKAKGILIVDANLDTRLTLSDLLQGGGFSNVRVESSWEEGLSALAAHCADIYLVLLGRSLPGLTQQDALRDLMNLHKHPLGVFVFTGPLSLLSGHEFIGSELPHSLMLEFLPIPEDRRDGGEFVERVLMILDCVHRKRLGENIPSLTLQETVRKLEDRLMKEALKRTPSKHWVKPPS